MTETPKPVEVTQAPTHYCVVCAARWVKHPDDTWSVQTNCGPCCDNVPMDKAPLIEFQADGSLSGRDHERVKGSYDAARRREQVERYRGIACAICDEPFERHLDNWGCPRRVKQSFKFPADTRPEAQSLPTVSGNVERIKAHVRNFDTPKADDPRRRYTEAQLHTAIRLATLSPTVSEDGLADESAEATIADLEDCLNNLLAIIFRDGGQRLGELGGWQEACEEAVRLSAERISAQDELSALRAQPSNEAQGWRDIASAPENENLLLAYEYDFPTRHWEIETGFACTHGTHGARSWHGMATHWRPLPAAPAALNPEGNDHAG